MTAERPEALDGVHEAFLAEPDAPLPDLVRPVVADSWRRSLRLGVDPVAHAPIEFNDSSLAAYRDAHPLAPLMPLVRSLLADDAEEAGHIVAVGDAQGRLLWVEGHRGLRGRAEAMHFVAGALWSEGGAGTNAPGTALATRKPVQIAASEHFGLQVHPWSCVAAPVRDPLSGELLGVVDLTGGAELAGPRSLALVRACASAMESQLLAAARERAAWESTRPTVIGVPRRPRSSRTPCAPPGRRPRRPPAPPR
jgi:transcriptional regulator of acetoin/glycerol metabolism